MVVQPTQERTSPTLCTSSPPRPDHQSSIPNPSGSPPAKLEKRLTMRQCKKTTSLPRSQRCTLRFHRQRRGSCVELVLTLFFQLPQSTSTSQPPRLRRPFPRPTNTLPGSCTSGLKKRDVCNRSPHVIPDSFIRHFGAYPAFSVLRSAGSASLYGRGKASPTSPLAYKKRRFPRRRRGSSKLERARPMGPNCRRPVGAWT